jgi:ribulose-5-phosphate 4-epimerase/fuculose-1-phosphate aldolase
MPNPLADARRELALANRIIANEGVLDAFGHVSMRHPTDANRYLLSRSRSPEIVQASDILEFTLDSDPIVPTDLRLYGERAIHGQIYKARPDVMAVCHHHSMSVLPFANSGVELVPLFHLGATGGGKIPFWDSRDDFGDTDLLVRKPEEGASLARALGPHWMVLMRRHGATVVGRTLQEMVFRTIYSARNAELQLRTQAIGRISPLTEAEASLSGEGNLRPTPISRAWEYWVMRLEKVERVPANLVQHPTNAKPPQRSKARAAKKSQRKSKVRKRR